MYDDLCSDAIAFVQSVYQFLEVDPSFIPDLEARNISGEPKNRSLHKLIYRDNPVKRVVNQVLPQEKRAQIKQYLKQKNTKPKPQFNAETRQRLLEAYRHDIVQLQDLIERDLSHWLSV